MVIQEREGGRDWWKVKEKLILGSKEFERWQESLESERGEAFLRGKKFVEGWDCGEENDGFENKNRRLEGLSKFEGRGTRQNEGGIRVGVGVLG